MSILDTITSLNQEASVRAGSDKGRRGPDELALPAEDGEMDMSVDEEGDGHHDGRTLEEAREPAAEVQALEVKTEDTQEHMDLGKEALMEEVKMEEEEESGAQEQTEEERESAASKTTGRPAEEKRDEDDGGDDVLTSTSQAKQKDRERIKEGELMSPHPLRTSLMKLCFVFRSCGDEEHTEMSLGPSSVVGQLEAIWKTSSFQNIQICQRNNLEPKK